MNRWFIQDYEKFLEAKSIMTGVAEDLIKNYDISKPVVIVGATLPSDDICKEAGISIDSWKYKVILRMTAFDPTLVGKFHSNFSGQVYYCFTESPLLSVLTWAANPYENCDVAASQQYISFWNMIGYDNFTYAPDSEMILRAKQIWTDNKMVGYPREGYIYDAGEMIIISLSDAE